MNFLSLCYSSFVNLDHRIDRLERMVKTLAGAGVTATRQRGMLPSEFTGDRRKVDVMQRRTPGAIGCHYSQVAIMEEALRQGRHAFVMEDDLIFCEDFQKRLLHIQNFCENNEWDVIWMGGTFHVNPPYWHPHTLKRDCELTHDPRMVRTYGAFCTYAYIVNAASLEKILHQLEAGVHRSIGIDWLFIQLQPKLKTFAFVPGCITQYDNQSDIGKGMTIFSNFGKKMNGTPEKSAYWFQNKMEDFDPTTFNWAEARV